MSFAWPTKFPPVACVVPVPVLMKHPDFDAAKKRGDAAAAKRLVEALAQPEPFRKLAALHPNARLICVGGDDATAANQIPGAFARYAADVTHLPLDAGVLKANSPKHTGKGALQRFLSRAQFDGQISTGANYIALDDVMTQGGTISELRQFLQRQGSRVVAVATLAFTDSTVMSDGQHLAPTVETRRALMGRFGLSALGQLLDEFAIYDGNALALTESEGRMILRYQNLDVLRLALLEEKAKLDQAQPAPLPRPRYSSGSRSRSA